MAVSNLLALLATKKLHACLFGYRKENFFRDLFKGLLYGYLSTEHGKKTNDSKNMQQRKRFHESWYKNIQFQRLAIQIP